MTASPMNFSTVPVTIFRCSRLTGATWTSKAAHSLQSFAHSGILMSAHGTLEDPECTSGARFVVSPSPKLHLDFAR